MQTSTYSVAKSVRAGSVGGLVGAVILGTLAVLGSMAMDQEVFYVTIGKKLGLGDTAVLGGWTLHFIVGLVAGAVFISTTSQVRMLSLTNARRALSIGALAGAAVWLIVYVPVTGTLVPADLTDPTFATGSFILHLVHGISTALVALRLLPRNVNPVPKT